VHPAWIHVFRRKILGDVLRNVGCNPILAFPVKEVGWVRAANDIDRIDAARLFLADALKNPFRARALNAHGNAGVFRLECLGESFRGRKLERRVERNLAFLAGGFDKRRRDCTRLSRGGFKGFREDGAGGHRRRRFKHIASGMRRLSHGSHLH